MGSIWRDHETGTAKAGGEGRENAGRQWSRENEAAGQTGQQPQAGLPGEDASRYCPVCSHRLESRRCKLICAVCGYYMSCADYY